MVLLLAILVGCRDPAPQDPPLFVRGGVLIDVSPDQRRFVAVPWAPGDVVTVEGLTAPAPTKPSCGALFHQPIGDLSRWTAAGGPPPDTALAFSPDGQQLAVGTFTGKVLVMDAHTGALVAEKTVPEGIAKRLGFSPDGSTLWVGTQAPRAEIWALDAKTLAVRSSLDTEALVATSPLPPGEDLFGIYTLPYVAGLDVLADGSVLVALAHGWNQEGVRRNRTQLLLLDPQGQIAGRWPAEPVEALLREPRIAADGLSVVVPVGRSAEGPVPEGLPREGLVVLSLPGLEARETVEIPPLAPWYTEAFVWEAVGLGPRLAVGLGDGRLMMYEGREAAAQVDLGTPVMAGAVPVAASIGHGRWVGPDFLALTSSSSIPYGAAAPDLRPPIAHPQENTLWAIGPDGKERWSWRGVWQLDGLAASPDHQFVALGAGPRVGDDREDLFGALLFDASPGEKTGDQRLLAACPTGSPVFFRMAVAKDGRVAVAEHPWRRPDGSLAGDYRVTVLR